MKSPRFRSIRKSKRTPPSQVLLRGLELLEVLNQRQVTRVSMLVEATGLPRASVVRMLQLLESESFVRRLPKRRGYSIDERALALSAGYRLEDAAVTAARPILSAFTATYKWPIAIGTRDGATIRVRESTLEESKLSAYGDDRFIGRRIPMLQSAMGRAYLSFCPFHERQEILALLLAPRRDQNPPSRQAIAGLLRSVRSAGYAITEPAVADRAFGLALPVRYQDRMLATISMRYLGKSNSAEHEVARRYLQPIRDAASAITAAVAEKAKLFES